MTVITRAGGKVGKIDIDLIPLDVMGQELVVLDVAPSGIILLRNPLCRLSFQDSLLRFLSIGFFTFSNGPASHSHQLIFLLGK